MHSVAHDDQIDIGILAGFDLRHVHSVVAILIILVRDIGESFDFLRDDSWRGTTNEDLRPNYNPRRNINSASEIFGPRNYLIS